MRHLIICREFPPAPGGGIGTYVSNISELLAEAGETVHVIGQQWKGAAKQLEERCSGRLIIHRIPFENWTTLLKPKPNRLIKSKVEQSLFKTSFFPLCYSWQVAILAEKLIKSENIDIVEAQEYEAPLYYLQLRRALGNSSSKTPPCIVHLHSPTELVGQFNDWASNDPFFNTAKQVERYSILAADALLCPSHFLGNQVKEHYRTKQSVKTIPYPVGDLTPLNRSEGTWNKGSICYVGRLERRKGVIEWIDACVGVAKDYPEIRFEFVGDNILDTRTLCGEEFVQNRIPGELKHQFHFYGGVPRSQIPSILEKARIAVVPSRWENYPYTCIEEMASGLPVITSPEGGMREMVEDGKSGWIAEQMNAGFLARTLKLALQTSPLKLAEMGGEATKRIQKICADQSICNQHLEFKNQILNKGAKFSLQIPHKVRFSANEPDDTIKNSKSGMVIILEIGSQIRYSESSWKSIQNQSQKPEAIILTLSKSLDQKPDWLVNSAKDDQVHLIFGDFENDGAVKNKALEKIRSFENRPLALAFLTSDDILDSDFVEQTMGVFLKNQYVDVVSCWLEISLSNKKRLLLNPPPEFCSQWTANQIPFLSTIRYQAIESIMGFSEKLSKGFEMWDLFNGLMLNHGSIVSIPKIMASKQNCLKLMTYPALPDPDECQREIMLRRFSSEQLENLSDLINSPSGDTNRFLRYKLSPKRFVSRIKMKIVNTNRRILKQLLITE